MKSGEVGRFAEVIRRIEIAATRSQIPEIADLLREDAAFLAAEVEKREAIALEAKTAKLLVDEFEDRAEQAQAQVERLEAALQDLIEIITRIEKYTSLPNHLYEKDWLIFQTALVKARRILKEKK